MNSKFKVTYGGLSPAISYIFSLGAPTPKVLANIKTTHPTVVEVSHDDPVSFEVNVKAFGPVYNELHSEDHGFSVYKTPAYIFVVSKPNLEI